MSDGQAGAIAVVVGLLTNARGEILLGQRPAHKSYPLQWEFPGGKVEPGESPAEALARELAEELAIDAVAGQLLFSKTSFYADGGNFAVGYYAVEQWSGSIVNHAFATVQWVAPASFAAYDILAGNRENCDLLVTRALIVPG